MVRTPFVHIFVLIAFLVYIFSPVPMAQAQDFNLPAPGVMVHLSPPLEPSILKGIRVHPDNLFRIEFILDKGDSELSSDQLKNESSKLIKYFLASLTIPEKDLWVNLSPYEKDRIIPPSFGLTEMGRDLLAEDYMLKQITASLIYPEGEIGKKFWKRIYLEAAKHYGITNISVNTFNKVWIVPQKAVVFENAKAGTAYVVESKLKVMLEQDYLSLGKHQGIQSQVKNTNLLGSQVVREIVLPELTKEVNEDKSFSMLRQVYNSLILAVWYKNKIKNSILEQVYADKNKIAGVGYTSSLIRPNSSEKINNDIEEIYQRYLRAFKKGVYNYIKVDVDPQTQEDIPRKYFSGGMDLRLLHADSAMTGSKPKSIFTVISDAAQIKGLNYNAGKRFFNVAIALTMATAVLLTPFSAQAAKKKHRAVTHPKVAVKSASTVLSPGAVNVLKQLNLLTPMQIKEITRKALQSVIDNTKASGHGITSVKATMKSLRIPGADLDAQLTAYGTTMFNALKNSPNLLEHLKNSSDILGDLNKEIAILIQIESSGILTVISTRPDGGEDQGAMQTHGFDHPFSYYKDKPLEYLYETITKHWNVTMGVALTRADEVLKIYGPSYMGYFGFDKQTLQFYLARALWNGGNGLKVNVLSRIPLLVYVPQGRATFMSTKVALAAAEMGVKFLNTDTPNLKGVGWGNVEERLAEDDTILKMFEELNRINNLPLPVNQREQLFAVQKQKIAQRIKDFQTKYILKPVAMNNKIIDSLFASDLRIQIINEYTDSTIVRQVTIFKSQQHNRINAAMSTPAKGGIDLSFVNKDLQAQNAGEAINFHVDPGLLEQLKNSPGLVPVIISIKPMTSVMQFLGVKVESDIKT